MTIAILVDGALSLPETPPDAVDTLRVAEAVAEVLPEAELVFVRPPLLLGLRALKAKVAFNLLESLKGETRFEPLAADAIRRVGLRRTGSGGATLRLCLHKREAKRALCVAGLPTPRWVVLTRPAPLSFPLPAIVKPAREDGSIGIEPAAVVSDPAALMERVAYVLKNFQQPALVEEFIEGRELNLSLLETREGVRLLPPAEITFTSLPEGLPKIVAYDAKWTPGSVYYSCTERVFPTLSDRLSDRITRLSKAVFSAFGMEGYGRVDLRLDHRERPFVIDVNPNCDLSPDAGFAAAAQRAGLDYRQLILQIVNTAR